VREKVHLFEMEVLTLFWSINIAPTLENSLCHSFGMLHYCSGTGNAKEKCYLVDWNMIRIM
jgi:hypothetical protein